MPISHVSKVYAIDDAKIAKLTADPAGGSPTYASVVDVPGIKSIGISGDVTNVELRGDNSLLDSNSTLSSITVTVEHAKISLDVLPVILGGTTTDSGTTPNMIGSYVRAGTDVFNYFKIEGRTPVGGADTITGDMHIILHKCILTSFPSIGYAEEDYAIVSFEAKATPLLATGNAWITVKLNETAAAIS